ncbi:MAG: hypothetical protein NTV56_00140 [Alphaproteobacteria bacterium]|nr:hypothetical protein [Alphaproteobacteria bacterium]
MSKPHKCDDILIRHRFLNRKIDPQTQTLIVGTSNPAADKNPATFFYSRGKNYLWRLLPSAFANTADMKSASPEEKMQFIKRHNIDFIDLISEVHVEIGKEASYADDYIDDKVTQWRDVIQEIDHLKYLKRVCVTRKTFSGIRQMKERIRLIQEHCEKREITFKCLSTPARFWS